MKIKYISLLKLFAFTFLISIFLSNTAFAESKPVIQLNHMFITVQNTQLNIQQIMQIAVPEGYKEIQNGKEIKAFITLPAGFSNVTVDGINKDQYVILDNGIGIVSILQSPLKLSFNYNLPYNEGNSIKIAYPYTCEMFAVLTTPGELAVNSKSLTPQGVLDITGKSFDVYATGNLNENVPITFQLVKGQGNLQKAPQVYTDQSVNLKFHSPEHIQRWKNSPLGNTNPHLWLIFLIFVIGGIIVALILLYRNKQVEFDEDEFVAKVKQLKADEQEILAKIELLEEKYAKKEITE